MDNKPIYKFTLPYPWKKTLYGIYWITIGSYVLIVILAYNSFILKQNPPNYGWFLFSLLSIGGIALGLALLMRYVLIHGDKIKEPIEVWVDKWVIHYKKGNINKEFEMEGLKTVRVVLNDKKVIIETNYEKDEDWEKGWIVGFKRKNELADIDYKEFIEKTFIPFTEVVIRRLKELNPGIRVNIIDERKKYR